MAYSNPVPELDDKIERINIRSESDYKPITEVYFAFIDVLGFKKTFEDIKVTNEKNIANKYRNVFNYYFSLMNSSKFMERSSGSGCYAGQTSDSLYFYTDRPDYLMQFIKVFSHFNLYAMSKDVFFRGGIAKGSLYTKEEYQFYGDSVIGAYLLESNISKNPIILIDEKTHKDMSEFHDYNNLVCTDEKNNRHYIKPFAFLDGDISLDIEEGFILNGIDESEIRKNIINNKAAFEYDAKNYSKYVFLLNEFEERYRFTKKEKE